jgi:hypothetical protein
MQNSIALSHNGTAAQVAPSLAPDRRRREFIDSPTLMLLRQIGAQYPLSIWCPRGRVAIYPALSQREWLWLRDWCEFAEGREVKQDRFFYYQRSGGRL